MLWSEVSKCLEENSLTRTASHLNEARMSIRLINFCFELEIKARLIKLMRSEAFRVEIVWKSEF